MSTDAHTEDRTKVVGYFNPNTWPVQVSISALNRIITVEPKQYVVDASGKKLNDPILDACVGPKRLVREENDKETVPLIRIRANPVPQGDPRGHSITQKVKVDGKWQAVEPPSKTSNEPIPAATYNPVRGMSVADARRLGFIGKQRLVPEDYGAPEGGGSPVTGNRIPHIKHSIEAPAPLARAGHLPEALVKQVEPGNSLLVQSLAQAAAGTPGIPPLLNPAIANVVEANVAQEVERIEIDVSTLPQPILPDEVPARKKRAKAEHKCNQCDKVYGKSSHLTRHIETAHPPAVTAETV